MLLQEFSLSSSISSDYQSFYSSDKNIFIGADRTGISGSVTTEADARSLFEVLNDALTEEELRITRTLRHCKTTTYRIQRAIATTAH